MDSTFFDIAGGSLEFQSSKIIISDKEKSRRNLWLISAGCTLIVGFALIVSDRRDHDNLTFYIGIVILLMEIILIYIGIKGNQFRRVDDRIPLDKIRSVALKPTFYGDTMMVTISYDKDRIRKFQIIYEGNQYPDFKALLHGHKIEFTESDSRN